MLVDDLVPVLAPPPASGSAAVGYRQGVIRSYDQTTGANTVDVGGATLTNLPLLNTSEALLLVPGAVVGVLTAGPSWFILGRVTVPGTPEALSALSMISSRIVAAVDLAQGTRSSNSFGDLSGASVGPSVTVSISASGKALAFWGAGYGATGTWESLSTSGTSVAVSGATTRAASSDYSLGHHMEFPVSPNPGNALSNTSHQNSLMHLFEGLNPGSNTFTMKYRNLRNAGNVQFDTREIAVFAL
jgi:hypothetical protein